MAKQEIERRGLVAMLAGAIIAATGPSLADEAIDPQARDAVTKMGKTLSTGAFSFQSDTIRQYEKDNLPLHILHSADIVRHPDRLMVSIKGHDGQTLISYDGETVTVYNVTANKYGQMSITGSVELRFRAASAFRRSCFFWRGRWHGYRAHAGRSPLTSPRKLAIFGWYGSITKIG